MKNLKIFTSNIEENAKSQIDLLLEQDAFKDCKVRIMPDVHAGSGCIMSRMEAKKKLKLADFTNVMKGVYSTSVCSDTIDEAPMVYKPMDEIIKNIGDTVEIVDVIKPIYNFKAKE